MYTSTYILTLLSRTNLAGIGDRVRGRSDPHAHSHIPIVSRKGHLAQIPPIFRKGEIVQRGSDQSDCLYISRRRLPGHTSTQAVDHYRAVANYGRAVSAEELECVEIEAEPWRGDGDGLGVGVWGRSEMVGLWVGGEEEGCVV